MMDVNETTAKCRKKGMRITTQRVEILKLLEGNRSHPTAEEIYRKLKKKKPNISRATVYNTINMLVELGELRELSNSSGCRRFDPNITPHDHAICEVCGEFFDVPKTTKEYKTIQIMDKSFRVTTREVTYHGLCESCTGSG